MRENWLRFCSQRLLGFWCSQGRLSASNNETVIQLFDEFGMCSAITFEVESTFKMHFCDTMSNGGHGAVECTWKIEQSGIEVQSLGKFQMHFGEKAQSFSLNVGIECSKIDCYHQKQMKVWCTCDHCISLIKMQKCLVQVQCKHFAWTHCQMKSAMVLASTCKLRLHFGRFDPLNFFIFSCLECVFEVQLSFLKPKSVLACGNQVWPLILPKMHAQLLDCIGLEQSSKWESNGDKQHQMMLHMPNCHWKLENKRKCNGHSHLQCSGFGVWRQTNELRDIDGQMKFLSITFAFWFLVFCCESITVEFTHFCAPGIHKSLTKKGICPKNSISFQQKWHLQVKNALKQTPLSFCHWIWYKMMHFPFFRHISVTLLQMVPKIARIPGGNRIVGGDRNAQIVVAIVTSYCSGMAIPFSRLC